MRTKQDAVLAWLLEENQPASRYYTLTGLMGRSEYDPDVKKAKNEIPKRGWAFDILKLQKPRGHWEKESSLYVPKYTSTNWRALVLSDLALTKKEEKIRKTADLFFDQWLSEDKENIFKEEVCIVGNNARMMARFGYGDDPRVKKLFDRLLEIQKEDGGWHCFDSKTGTLDCWEALASFAVLPKSKRSRKISSSIDRGAEFYLSRNLIKEGKTKKYLPWFRFHYPNHYYYDLLVGLDVITSLGYSDDRRLEPAAQILKDKQRADGTWALDKVHPDVGRGANYPRIKRKYFAIETEGKPSKWITLKALSVLKRIFDAGLKV